MAIRSEISTPFQQVWLAKLIGFDYEIQYKSGVENKVANALSRVRGAEIISMAISVISGDLSSKIKQSYHLDFNLVDIIEELQDSETYGNYKLVSGLLRKKRRIVVGPDPLLKTQIIQWMHASPESGHSGRELTTKRIKQLFIWKGLTRDVSSFVRNCTICQASKYNHSASPGLLQPLPIPSEVWVDVSMDFITGLPKSAGKEVILVVVDRLSKYAHFIALKHPFTAFEVAQAYLDHVFKLHGWPRSIVSDRDAIFLSNFWQALFSLQGTEFHMSSSYHPQTDGQTEIVNKCLENYLRCMTGDAPSEWSQWLPLAEWWYNTHFHTVIQLTPYEVVYSQPPPLHLPYLP